RLQPAAHGVADDCATHRATHDEAKTHVITRRGNDVRDSVCSSTSFTPANHALVIRTAGESIGSRKHRPTGYADSSVRPLPRRAARIARPARVRIRARKPCFLARRRLFGW